MSVTESELKRIQKEGGKVKRPAKNVEAPAPESTTVAEVSQKLLQVTEVLDSLQIAVAQMRNDQETMMMRMATAINQKFNRATVVRKKIPGIDVAVIDYVEYSNEG